MKTKHVVLAGFGCVIASVLISYTLGGSKGGTGDVQKVTAELKELKKDFEGLKTDLNMLKLGKKDSVRKIQGATGEQGGSGLNVATISIRKIFQECKRGDTYRKKAMAEQDRVIAELEELSKEIEAEQAGLAVLRENSSDYMTRAKELFEKQANYQARQEFYKQQMEFNDQLWTKELYQDILRVTGEVAKDKGFDLVFREDEIDFSETNITELGLAMRSHKLLYSDGCVDISNEVIARLDAEEE